jgi:hypothetical protein
MREIDRIPEYKECSVCKVVKHWTEFYKSFRYNKKRDTSYAYISYDCRICKNQSATLRHRMIATGLLSHLFNELNNTTIHTKFGDVTINDAITITDLRKLIVSGYGILFKDLNKSCKIIYKDL